MSPQISHLKRQKGTLRALFSVLTATRQRGIRAVRDGEELGYPILKNGTALPTCSHDRRVPAETPDADRKLIRAVAQDVVAATLKSGLPA